MSKLTLNNIQGQFASTTELNSNFDLIETALENTVSRDGSSPNTMSADLDLNSQDINNANIVNAVAVRVSGQSIVPGDTLTVPAAASVPNTPAGNISATDVQAALNELDTEKLVIADNLVKPYDNIAALRAITSAPLVKLSKKKVHTTDGDGGEGDWYWHSTSTDTDNNGTTIKAPAITIGRWIRLYSGSVNALWFGAVADGVTDSTSAIQNAINYAATHNLSLYIPSGHYKATNLYLRYDATNNTGFPTNGGRWTMFGEGRGEYAQIIAGTYTECTVIECTNTTGILIDGAHNVSPWRLREFEMHHLTFVGTTIGSLLDTSGSFKSRYHEMTLHNPGTGDGWIDRNFDQNVIDSIKIIGNTSSPSAGTGFILGNESTGIDGSVSTLANILVRDYALGYSFGFDRTDEDGNFQKFNTISNCATNGCTVGALIGDRWENNTFVSCQFRGSDYGVKLAGRNQLNNFISTLCQSTSDSTSVTGLYLGWGSSSGNRTTKQNTFSNCDFSSGSSGNPVTWQSGTAAGSDSVVGNSLANCKFTATNAAITYAVLFTSTPANNITGAVINPVLDNCTSLFSASSNSLEYTNNAIQRKRIYKVSTTDATVTNLARIEIPTGSVISITAHVVANDNTGTTAHAGYIVSGTAWNNAGTAILIGAATAIATHEITAGMNCTITVSDDDIRVRITGVAATDLEWTGVIDVIVSTG